MGRLAMFVTLVISAAATAWGDTSGKDLGAVSGGDFTPNKVFETKCLTCHNKDRIDMALRQKKDMNKVTTSMEKKGLKLSDKEREVLGIFWKQQNPIK